MHQGERPARANADEMPEPSPRLHFSFAHRLRVRWAEVDAQGIVFNPNYLMYADVAFTEYMRAIGLAYPDDLYRAGSDLFMVAASAQFKKSARYDDELDLAVRVAQIGHTSLRIDVHISQGDALLVALELTYVNADRGTQTAAPLPATLVDRILAFERTAPATKPR